MIDCEGSVAGRSKVYKQGRCMSEDEKLSRLIGEILDAALDSALWTTALAGICEFVNGQAGGLLSKDSVAKSGNAHYYYNVDPYYVQNYAATYVKFCPTAALPLFETEQIVSIPDLVPYEEFRQGRFYHEWVRPQGWIDSANVVLERMATSCSYLCVIRDEAAGMVDDDMRRRLQLIIPHVRRAVLIGKAIDLKRYQAATFADAMDVLEAGVFLVDAGGRIVHANIAGDDMLREEAVFRSTGGRMEAQDPEVDRMLCKIFAAAGDKGDAIGTSGIALPLTGRDGARFVADVLPLTAGVRRQAGIAYSATAAVFVRKAALATSSAPEVIGKAFKLTPTELRVLLAIVEVGGVARVAAALGIADSTVKTHLGRVFEKTGASQQADLVKLVAAYAMPLVERS
jgi:DNA-binding CsgD family transcriptional regulator/PAS domain-containing protein